MVLSSFSFLLFIAVCVPVYYALPVKLRNGFLLAGGTVFYCFGAPVYLPLVAATSLFGYFMAFALEKKGPEGGRALTFLSVAVPIGLLCAFKYLSAPLGALLSGIPLFSSVVAENAQGSLSLIMPLGISFYTFTLVGYLLDVRHGKIKAERSVVDFLAFVTFFPCILSGPINRAGEMLPQFKEKHEWSYGGTVYGLQRFLTGAFKKLVLADGLSLIVNGAWGDIEQYRGLTLWVAAIGYTVQLYCDFSGYTDMAVGAAALFGFKPRENFNAPYCAKSITDFWGRWNMSLTSWLRDYVYIPLGGNRKGYLRKLANIVIVFAISGLWHGEGVTYLIWGLFHALLRCVEDIAAKLKGERSAAGKKATFVKSLASRCCTLLAVSFGWIIFRAPSLAELAKYVGAMFSGGGAPLLPALRVFICEGLTYSNKHLYIYSFFVIAGLALLILFDRYTLVKGSRNPVGEIRGRKRMLVYWFMGLGCAAFYIMMLTLNNGVVSFIYQGY